MSQNRKGFFSKIEKVSSFTSVCFALYKSFVSILIFLPLILRKKGWKKSAARTLREGRVTRDESKQGALAADWLMEHKLQMSLDNGCDHVKLYFIWPD